MRHFPAVLLGTSVQLRFGTAFLRYISLLYVSLLATVLLTSRCSYCGVDLVSRAVAAVFRFSLLPTHLRHEEAVESD